MTTVRKRKYKSGKEVWFADFIVRGKRYRPVIEANNKLLRWQGNWKMISSTKDTI